MKPRKSRGGKRNTDESQNQVIREFLKRSGYRAKYESVLDHYRSETGYGEKQFYERLQRLDHEMRILTFGGQRIITYFANEKSKRVSPLISTFVRGDSMCIEQSIAKYPSLQSPSQKAGLVYNLFKKVIIERYLMWLILNSPYAEDIKDAEELVSYFDKSEMGRMNTFIVQQKLTDESFYRSFHTLMRKDLKASNKHLSKFVDFRQIGSPEAADDFFRSVFGGVS